MATKAKKKKATKGKAKGPKKKGRTGGVQKTLPGVKSEYHSKIHPLAQAHQREKDKIKVCNDRLEAIDKNLATAMKKAKRKAYRFDGVECWLEDIEKLKVKVQKS